MKMKKKFLILCEKSRKNIVIQCEIVYNYAHIRNDRRERI